MIKLFLGMNILERYIGKTILAMIFAVFLGIGGLVLIVKLVEEFKDVGKGAYDAWAAIQYSFFMLPSDMKEIVPAVVLIGGLLGLGNLASSSELTVMQASGFSRFRIGLAVMKTALPLIFFTMFVSEWGIPQLEQYARNMRSISQSGASMLATTSGFWAREGENFIYIRYISSEKELGDISIYHFNNKELKAITHAEQAVFQGNDWRIHNVNRSTIVSKKIVQSKEPDQVWKTSITPSKLGVISLKPESLSISGLADYVGFLKETGQDSKRFEIAFWRKIYQPISMVAMMLLAISFIFGPLRSSAMGTKLFIGIITGFVFLVANISFGNMTLVFWWLPVFIGALIPSAVCLTIVWWMLTKKRD